MTEILIYEGCNRGDWGIGEPIEGFVHADDSKKKALIHLITYAPLIEFVKKQKEDEASLDERIVKNRAIQLEVRKLINDLGFDALVGGIGNLKVAEISSPFIILEHYYDGEYVIKRDEADWIDMDKYIWINIC